MVDAAQPSGTVTLVFTDVEGSTRLLEELGPAAYRQALSEHRRAVRAACARHSGYEVDTAGDGFFLAFGSAEDAATAVSEALAATAEGPVRVRVGMHTGEPDLDPPAYVGLDVHRAARIMSAAHGGQAVVSPTTAALLAPESLRSLGQHRLKDLSGATPLYQLLVPGLPDAFPPLRTLHRSNLPVPATPFLGRRRELAELVERLAAGETRLLTLTGPGGTGKTRLGLQAAAEAADAFPDGIYWAPLAPVREPSLVVSAVAAALGVAEESDRRPLDSVAAALADRRLLLLLDNAEHLLPALAADVAALVAAAPTLTLLVTSRERLRVAGEETYAVPTLSASEGVELFLARARAADPGFSYTPAVDELCARLDDLPLALELAAARVGLLSTEQLLERLGRRLDLLRGPRDVDQRQQTLRATVAWSYELLDPEERRVFARLSVFAGGCALEAAEEVCDADLDTLQSLLDKSLLRRRDAAAGPRLWLLETIREFAAERLADDGAAAEVASRHREHYASLAARVARAGEELAQYDLDRLGAELDNLRLALDTGLASAPERALELAGDLGEYWLSRGVREGRERLAAALAAAPDAAAGVRARALRSAGVLALWQGELEDGRRELGDALALARAAGDRALVGFALTSLGIEAWYRGALEEASALLEEAVEEHRAAGNARGELMALSNLAVVAHEAGDPGRAADLLAGTVAALRGRDERSLARVLVNLGVAQEAAGLRDEAQASFAESVALSREHGLEETLGYALASVGHLLLDSDPASAGELYRDGLEVMRRSRDLRGIAYCLEGLAAVAVRSGRPESSPRLLGAAAALRAETGAALGAAERDELEDTRSRAAAILGEASFAARWDEGSRRGLERALEDAEAP